MIKIKNRNQYDIVYECLIHCRKYEKSETLPNTRTRFYTILGGNSKALKKIFSDVIIKYGLVEVNSDVDHYRDVYKITQKGQNYINCYEGLKGLLMDET